MAKVYVIGIGYTPLDSRRAEIIRSSRAVLASDPVVHVFEHYVEFSAVQNRVLVIDDIEDTFSHLHSRLADPDGRPLTLLASGDPLFHGIGRRALWEFGRERIEILPDLSSVKVSFARIKEAWDDALLVSLHGGPNPAKRRQLQHRVDAVPSLLRRHGKIAVLPGEVNHSGAIARMLCDGGQAVARMYVCERLGCSDEQVVTGRAEELCSREFREPNVHIIMPTQLPPAC